MSMTQCTDGYTGFTVLEEACFQWGDTATSNSRLEVRTYLRGHYLTEVDPLLCLTWSVR
jgi:hypothetical protein